MGQPIPMGRLSEAETGGGSSTCLPTIFCGWRGARKRRPLQLSSARTAGGIGGGRRATGLSTLCAADGNSEDGGCRTVPAKTSSAFAFAFGGPGGAISERVDEGQVGRLSTVAPCR